MTCHTIHTFNMSLIYEEEVIIRLLSELLSFQKLLYVYIFPNVSPSLSFYYVPVKVEAEFMGGLS